MVFTEVTVHSVTEENSNMCKKCFHAYLAISVVLGSVMAASPARSQGGGDPIGNLTKTSIFDRAQRVIVGKSSKGKLACFIEQEGSTATLYIGISPDGAFIRVESGPDRLPNESNFNPALPLVTRTNPKSPVRIFAAKGLTKAVDGDVKLTGEYAQIQSYDGAVIYVPNIDTVYGDGFIVVAKDDTKSFFEMVVRAHDEFIVVQSVSEPKDLDGMGIYGFKASTMSALLACAKRYNIN
jgi:hypothetical protein